MFAGVAGDVARNNIDYDVIYSSTHLQMFYQVLIYRVRLCYNHDERFLLICAK